MLRPHKRIRIDNNLSTNKTKSFTIDLSEFNNITTIDELLNILNVSQLKQTHLFINIDTLYNLKEPLIKLNNMIGLNEFKEAIVNMILYYIQGLDNNEMFNTVLQGPPGCGKTEIAQILADIYSKLGKLSKGTFTSVKRHDLVAEYLGQTAIKTNRVLKDALGGVLFIDEAYSLGNSEKRDSFAKECIDTINHFLTENADDFVVIIAGYSEELKNQFFSMNRGLERRFPWKFKIDNYSNTDLYNIFIKQCSDANWSVINKKYIESFFEKNYESFPFFGGDTMTFFYKCKIAHARRSITIPSHLKRKLSNSDIDNAFILFKSKSDDDDNNTYKFMYI